MANFEKDLASFETILGSISGETLRLWSSKIPDLNERYNKLVTEPIRYRGRYVPLGYIGKGGAATPVKAHMLALIVALAKVKFEKRYSLGEAISLLAQVGLTVTKAGLGKVFPRYSDALNVTYLIPDKATKVVEIKSLADAEQLVQRERKNFAKKAHKEGWSGEKVKEELNKNKKKGVSKSHKKTERTIESKEEMVAEEFKGREIAYEPTAKQTLFHAASEKIVLYGGAAG